MHDDHAAEIRENGEIGNASGEAEIRKARWRAGVSILVNLFLAVGKGVAGVMGGSSALVGDAVHSATDVVGSSAAWFGLWLAGKKHPSFPYGLYKAETLATLLTSVVVILAGYEIGRQALLGPETIPDVAATLPVAVIALVITLTFGMYQLRAGRKLHSKALEADARDYLADAMSTSVVLLSLIGAYFGLSLDRWAAAAVAVFIFWSGGNLLWRALCDLLDEAIDRETERDIIELVNSHPRVDHVERILSRTAGGRFIVDLDVVVRSTSHNLAHRLAHLLESEIQENHPRVVMARIKTHSREPAEFSRLTPVSEPGGEITAHLGGAPWFLRETVDRHSGKVSGREYLRNPHRNASRKKGYLVGKWMLALKPDQLVVTEERKSTAIALLKEAGVRVIVAPETSPDNR
ncbi:Cobalt-zinc-cadmium resistance protein [Olavius algarvensis associated proteobacterium Delta 3]|nr:Cobalt-zinc-cadmium resistance protein [Olavius algarvensis associated proteobacterium Delta 3]